MIDRFLYLYNANLDNPFIDKEIKFDECHCFSTEDVLNVEDECIKINFPTFFEYDDVINKEYFKYFHKIYYQSFYEYWKQYTTFKFINSMPLKLVKEIISSEWFNQDYLKKELHEYFPDAKITIIENRPSWKKIAAVNFLGCEQHSYQLSDNIILGSRIYVLQGLCEILIEGYSLIDAYRLVQGLKSRMSKRLNFYQEQGIQWRVSFLIDLTREQPGQLGQSMLLGWNSYLCYSNQMIIKKMIF